MIITKNVQMLSEVTLRNITSSCEDFPRIIMQLKKKIFQCATHTTITNQHQTIKLEIK